MRRAAEIYFALSQLSVVSGAERGVAKDVTVQLMHFQKAVPNTYTFYPSQMQLVSLKTLWLNSALV